MAEVELPSQATAVFLPAWIGEEVTGDSRYYNANLVGHPFKEWGQALNRRARRVGGGSITWARSRERGRGGLGRNVRDRRSRAMAVRMGYGSGRGIGPWTLTPS